MQDGDEPVSSWYSVGQNHGSYRFFPFRRRRGGWGVRSKGGGLSTARRGFAREIASLGEIFQFLEEFVERHEADERTALAINLVVEELFTNMVRHNLGGSTEIVICLEWLDGQLNLELIDTEVEDFDLDTVDEVPVTAGIDQRRPGGLGIHLVRSLVDDLQYDYRAEDRRMRISVVKTLEK